MSIFFIFPGISQLFYPFPQNARSGKKVLFSFWEIFSRPGFIYIFFSCLLTSFIFPSCFVTLLPCSTTAAFTSSLITIIISFYFCEPPPPPPVMIITLLTPHDDYSLTHNTIPFLLLSFSPFPSNKIRIRNNNHHRSFLFPFLYVAPKLSLSCHLFPHSFHFIAFYQLYIVLSANFPAKALSLLFSRFLLLLFLLPPPLPNPFNRFIIFVCAVIICCGFPLACLENYGWIHTIKKRVCGHVYDDGSFSYIIYFSARRLNAKKKRKWC